MKTPPSCHHCPAAATVLVAGIPLCETCYAAYDMSGDDFDANNAGENAGAYASPPCSLHLFDSDFEDGEPRND